MEEYDYRNCQSLFGYSVKVHIRCKGICQLCGCGGDFDLWRQMTVEHLIGRSQQGYLKDIKSLVKESFPHLSKERQLTLSQKIDATNTVTACQFCNSTTSRDQNDLSMSELFKENTQSEDALINAVTKECAKVLSKKRNVVNWKLRSVRKAYDSIVKPSFDK